MASVLVAVAWGLVLGPAAGSLEAQVLQGRVVDQSDESAISGVLVRLVDSTGVAVAVTVSNDEGGYEVDAPEPGTFRIQAARLGFRDFETPMLEVLSPEGRYEVELVLQPAPVELPGFTVETRRWGPAEVRRRVQLAVGVSPASLRMQPILKETLIDHAERAHSLADMMRWTNAAGLITMETDEGPCVQARGRGCLPYYLNDVRLNDEFIDTLPLDMLEMVVVLYPNETIAYGSGAILMYTEAWIR